jgi:serine protease AprX
MRGITHWLARLSVTALFVSVLTPLAAMGGAGPAAAAPGGSVPTLGPGLVEQTADLGLLDKVDVIVSAFTFDGLSALDDLGVAYRPLESAPVALAEVTGGQLRQLVASAELRSIWPDEEFELFLTESTQIVGADRVQQLLGVDGTGVAVAVVDTGIDANHPDLPWHSKVAANYEVVADPFDPSSTLLVDLPDTDDDSHGTHVASTIAGNDADGGHLNDGVAPGAQLYGYSVNVGLTIDSARSLAAFDDIIQKRLAGLPIVAISNSWGGGAGDYNPDAPLSILTKAAYDANISVVFAAGNAGQEEGELNTASSQCTMPWVVCVGAETKPGQLVQFSSRGRPPVATQVTMPDGDVFDIPAGNHDRKLGQALNIGVFRPTVTAPGVNIVAACAKSACGVEGDYQSLSGTSMATPHVSGVVALVNATRLKFLKKLDLTAGQVIDLLESTANPMPGWRLWEAGVGEVDAYEASQKAKSAKIQLTPPNFGADPAALGAATQRSFTGTALPSSCTTGQGFGEHTVNVPGGTARLDLTVTWDLDTDNIYMYAWRPGVDPDGDGANRADQESWGLLEGLGPRTQTFRVGTVPYPEPGDWTVRVCGRVNPDPTAYDLVASTRPAARPTAAIKSATSRNGIVTMKGTGTFPARPSEGLTRESVAGSALPLSVVGTPTAYYLHGTVAEVDKHGEQWFGGPGPYFDQTPPTGAVPQFQTGGWYGNPDYAGNFLLAYWRGAFEGTIQGDVVVDLWLSSVTESQGGQITFTLFDVPAAGIGEGFPVIARATVSGVGIGATPTEVQGTLRNVAYTVPAGHEVVLSVSGTFIDADYFTAWYDAVTSPSSLTLPVLASGPTGAPPRASGVQATDLVGSGVRVTWDAVDGATSYVVYRSTGAGTLGSSIATVLPSGQGRQSYVDASRAGGSIGYYRVVAKSVAAGEPSDAVVGVPVVDRLWVEVRAGRGPWETAKGTTSWSLGLTPAAGPGADGSTFTARARTWAGASTEAKTTV